MPQAPGLAFVIVTHLSPDRESLLPEIIARFTSLPVHVITDGMQIEVDNVYLLPTDAVLSVEKRALHVQPQDSHRRERKPIDVLFSSLAAEFGELSAGVVLSGGDSDGTLGIKADQGARRTDARAGGGRLRPAASRHAGQCNRHWTRRFRRAGRADGSEKLATFATGAFMLDGLAGNATAQAQTSEFDVAREAIYADLAQPGRTRFQRLQGQDFRAPRAAAHAGPRDRHARRLRGAALHGPAGSHALFPRPAHQRDQFLFAMRRRSRRSRAP